MREILFRGRGIRADTWYYGTYGVFRHDFTGEVDGHWIEDKIEGYGYNECQVDPETIGQYTGLKDKHGVKIFEGDTVKGRYTTDMGEISTIIWGDSSFCVYGVAQDGNNAGFACCPSEAKILEVIGNIHEAK